MKKTIYLKQITPMWHFLHNQEGCCLRATEVKPKLDKFLASLDPDNVLSKYKIGDTNAYDYKLSFLPTDNDKLSLNPNDFKLYFGNVGEGPKKELVYYTSSIQMNIFTLHKELETTILTNLADFFATHSFGTRQDKGFGFFFPEPRQKDVPLKDHGFNRFHGASYMFTINLTTAREQEIDDANNETDNQLSPEAVDQKLIFEHINYFHKIIRSGIDENGCCHKSFMYFYTSKKIGHSWDKDIIKSYFGLFNDDEKKVNEQTVNHNNQHNENKEDLILFRDALGLSSNQLWLSYDKVINIESEKDECTRYKSPILYRPSIPYEIDKKTYVNIYIHFHEDEFEEFKNQSFKVSIEDNPDKPSKGGHSGKEHKKRSFVSVKDNPIEPLTGVPVYKRFSLISYFDYIFQNLADILTDYNTDDKPNRYLKRIFDLDGEDQYVGLYKL